MGTFFICNSNKWFRWMKWFSGLFIYFQHFPVDQQKSFCLICRRFGWMRIVRVSKLLRLTINRYWLMLEQCIFLIQYSLRPFRFIEILLKSCDQSCKVLTLSLNLVKCVKSVDSSAKKTGTSHCPNQTHSQIDVRIGLHFVYFVGFIFYNFIFAC